MVAVMVPASGCAGFGTDGPADGEADADDTDDDPEGADGEAQANEGVVAMKPTGSVPMNATPMTEMTVVSGEERERSEEGTNIETVSVQATVAQGSASAVAA